jgi:hypothetical protein
MQIYIINVAERRARERDGDKEIIFERRGGGERERGRESRCGDEERIVKLVICVL